MAKEDIVRENPYMYIVRHNKPGWYIAKMKGLSVSRIGQDLDEMENEFTAYIKRTFGKNKK